MTKRTLREIRKESWFHFMDRTWIVSMICDVKAGLSIMRQIHLAALFRSALLRIGAALDVSAVSWSQAIRVDRSLSELPVSLIVRRELRHTQLGCLSPGWLVVSAASLVPIKSRSFV